MTATLQDLAIKYNCDKWFAHSYIPFYEVLLGDRSVTRMLEIGIGYEDLMSPFVPSYTHGSSLLMWRDYFPQAEIFGCDNRPDTLIDHEPRIQTFLVDQSRQIELQRLMYAIGGEGFDVIIDDGSHVLDHQILTYTILHRYVRPGGVYIIEDVQQPNHLSRETGGSVYQFDKRPDDALVVVRC